MHLNCCDAVCAILHEFHWHKKANLQHLTALGANTQGKSFCNACLSYLPGAAGTEETRFKMIYIWRAIHQCHRHNGNYFNGGYATRVCNSQGVWLPPDYSNCSVNAGVGSFALVWMTFSTTSGTRVLNQLGRIQNDVCATTKITPQKV